MMRLKPALILGVAVGVISLLAVWTLYGESRASRGLSDPETRRGSSNPTEMSNLPEPRVGTPVIRSPLAGSGADGIPVPSSDTFTLEVRTEQALPVANRRVGLAAGRDVKWVATTDRLGRCTIPFTGAEPDYDLVVDASDHYRLKARLRDLSSEDGVVRVSLPGSSTVEVRVTNLGRGEECLVWCGRAEWAASAMDAGISGPWLLVHKSALRWTSGGATALELPTSSGFSIKATLSAAPVNPPSYEQPFGASVVFHVGDRLEAKSKLGVRIADRQGGVVDTTGVVALTFGGSTLRGELKGGRLDVARGLSIEGTPESSVVSVTSSDGEHWVAPLAEARLVSGGRVLTCVRGQGHPAMTVRAPSWAIEHMFVLQLDGAVREITPLRRASARDMFWRIGKDHLFIGGLPKKYESVWGFAKSGQTAMIQKGQRLVVLESNGLRTLDADSYRGLSVKKRALAIFEVQIPGQSWAGWLQIDSEYRSSLRKEPWLKVSNRGVPGRIRLVYDGVSRVVSRW